MHGARVLRVAALAVALCLGIASCGSPAPSSGGQATLEVSSFPAADIWIDGSWKGSTPASISVEPGTREVTLRQAGFAEHQEKVDVAAGGHRNLELTLVAENLDDANVLAQLARPFDVSVEAFEAPEVHRGGRKAPLAVLLWPQGDVRPVGLTSFAIEVSEEYEGDGYLVFRKGRNILYKELFNPELLTTVATIPLEVLQETDAGDTVTWGIAFDSRRKKDVESQFKVVNHPKADARLSKMAYDRHLARQPPMARALLEAATLENYRLYSEALVRSLEIVQDNPTSVAPYERIVTTLRRLDAKETRLWGVASQYVSGRGRGRASQSGIAAFAPQTARPLAVPTAPPVVAARPEGRSPLGAGDGVAPGLRPGGTEPAVPAAPGVGPSTAPGSDEASAGAGTSPVELDRASESAKRDAANLDGKAKDAQDRAAEAQAQANAASRDAEARRAELAEATRAHEENPSPETEDALARAQREADAAGGLAEAAEARAAQTAEEARQLGHRAKTARTAAELLARDAANLRAGGPAAPSGPGAGAPPADPSGRTPGQGPTSHGVAPTASGAVLEAERACAQVQEEVANLETLARDNPQDEELQAGLADARARLAQAQAEREAALEAYANAGTSGGTGAAAPRAGDRTAPGGREKPDPVASQPGPADLVAVAARAVSEAEQVLQDVQQLAADSPDDESVQAELTAARDRLEQAKQAHAQAMEAYANPTGDGSSSR